MESTVPILFVKGRICLKSFLVFYVVTTILLFVLESISFGILHVISVSQTFLARGLLIDHIHVNIHSFSDSSSYHYCRVFHSLFYSFQFFLEVSCEFMSKFFSLFQQLVHSARTANIVPASVLSPLLLVELWKVEPRLSHKTITTHSLPLP